MSKQRNDRGSESWFQERDEARAAGGTAPEGMAPGLNPQEGEPGGPASDEAPLGQNTDNRGIGQYTGEGTPSRQKR